MGRSWPAPQSGMVDPVCVNASGVLPCGIRGRFSGLDEALHAQKIVIHLMLGLCPKQGGNGVTDPSDRRVIRQPDVDGGSPLGVRLEAHNPGMLDHGVRLGPPGQYLIGM
jgi:hypothetical protein